MIVIDVSRCSGCRACETACSFYHTGRVGRGLARIKVVKIEGQGIDAPVACRQCAERPCLKCPEGAIEVGPLGQIIVSPTMCTGCGVCEKLCPVGAIELYEDIPRVCDLCGGQPRCVEACRMEALRHEPEAGGESYAHRKPKGMTPEAKRVAHAEEEARAIREVWLSRRKTSGGDES